MGGEVVNQALSPGTNLNSVYSAIINCELGVGGWERERKEA